MKNINEEQSSLSCCNLTDSRNCTSTFEFSITPHLWNAPYSSLLWCGIYSSCIILYGLDCGITCNYKLLSGTRNGCPYSFHGQLPKQCHVSKAGSTITTEVTAPNSPSVDLATRSSQWSHHLGNEERHHQGPFSAV